MTYAQQLRHPKWEQRRLQVIEKAGSRCECCGNFGINDGETSEVRFEIHHGYYTPGLMAWEYPDDVLYCLCPECHKDVQESMERAQYELAKRQLKLRMIIRDLINNYEIRPDRTDSINHFHQTRKFEFLINHG